MTCQSGLPTSYSFLVYTYTNTKANSHLKNLITRLHGAGGWEIIKRNTTPSDNSRLLTNVELNLHIQICWSSLENFATLPNGDNIRTRTEEKQTKLLATSHRMEGEVLINFIILWVCHFKNTPADLEGTFLGLATLRINLLEYQSYQYFFRYVFEVRNIPNQLHEQSPPWGPNSLSSSQEILCLVWNTEEHLCVQPSNHWTWSWARWSHSVISYCFF